MISEQFNKLVTKLQMEILISLIHVYNMTGVHTDLPHTVLGHNSES